MMHGLANCNLFHDIPSSPYYSLSLLMYLIHDLDQSILMIFKYNFFYNKDLRKYTLVSCFD
jgi:hypothetical protein